MADSYFGNVQVLASLDGSLNDMSPRSQTLTSVSTILSTSVINYYPYSTFFDGTSSYINIDGYVSIPADFTIEAWVYPTSVAAGWGGIYNCHGTTDIGLYRYGAAIVWYDGSNRVITSNISVNTWYHIAVVRASNVIQIFINGSVSGGSYSSFTDYSATTHRIGADGNLNEKFAGYISDVRVTEGVARYTTSFTPPQKFGITLSGKVTDYNSSSQVRTVRAYPRSSGYPCFETISNTEGLWYMDIPDVEVYVVALDDDSGLVQNALIQDRING